MTDPNMTPAPDGAMWVKGEVVTGSLIVAIGDQAMRAATAGHENRTQLPCPKEWRWTRQAHGWRVEKVYVDADVLPRLDG